ncbi:hypothetical protein [Kushneria aurantia]
MDSGLAGIKNRRERFLTPKAARRVHAMDGGLAGIKNRRERFLTPKAARRVHAMDGGHKKS